MGYDISNLHIEESTPEWRAIERVVEREGVTPEEVVRRGLSRIVEEELSPAEQMWGAFSSPEDSALMDEVMDFVRESRRIDAERLSKEWA